MKVRTTKALKDAHGTEFPAGVHVEVIRVPVLADEVVAGTLLWRGEKLWLAVDAWSCEPVEGHPELVRR